MKVSQLIHAMDKYDDIIINDENKPINNMQVYRGTVRGIKRDDPVNKMIVQNVLACDNVLIVLAANPRKKGGEQP